MFNGLKASHKGIAGILAVALLLVGIYFFPTSGKQPPKNDVALPAVTVAETKANAVPPAVEQKHDAKRTKKKHVAKGKSAEVKQVAKEENEPARPHAEGTILIQAPQLAPPLQSVKEAGEEENSDMARLRGSWFFDQRAYPNKHIPAGALQKAIEQRDRMRQDQRAAFRPGPSANAVVSFPGDALWHSMGPQPVNIPFTGLNAGFPTASGRVTAIAVDPTNANIVYIGGAAGGVWKTTDGGTTWAALTDSQPSLAVGSIAIDPNSCAPGPCTTIYVGTGEENFNIDAFYGAGILKSTNGGTSWTQLGASTFAQQLGPQTGGAYIGQIAVQPGNPNIVLAAVSFFVNGTNGGIYRSTDAGVTWTEDAAPQGLAATSVVFEPTSNNGTTATAWMAMGDLFGQAVNGIYKSTDSGATWTKQTSVLPTVNVGRIILGYAPSTSGATATLYAAIADSSTTSSNLLGLFKTTNAGTAWTAVTGPAVTGGFCAHQCFYDMAIGVSPANPSVVVLGGGAGPNNFTSLFESTNGGGAWTPASGAAGDFSNGSTNVHPHVDTHAIVFTANGATLFVGNDGGIWSTTTPTPAAGVSPTWSDLNAGLAITQFYPGPTAAVSDENYGFGGTQDNDTELFQGSGSLAMAWQNEFACGDGGFTAIDQRTPTTIYTGCNSLAGTKIKKAVMNGQFVTSGVGTIPGFDVAETAITNSGDNMQFIPPIALDESNPENLYFGTCRVWQTTNAASSLANTFLPLTPTWAPISGDLSNANAAITTSCPSAGGAGNITNLEVAHSSSSVIVAGTSNGKVWETTTGGLGGFWTEIDNGALPGRHVTAVRTKRSDATGQIVYVTFSGFDCGGGCGAAGHVFKTINGGTTWTNISGDLPDIPVNDIIVFHQSNPTTIDALYIATDAGVFACPDPEAATPCTNWTVIGDGLPNSPVLGLAMRRTSRILRAATHGRSMWQIQLTGAQLPTTLAALSGITPAAVNVVPGGAGTTAVTVTGLNFSANTQVQFAGTTTGVTTAFVNTTQLNVTLSNTLLQVGGVFRITLTDPAGVDPNSSLLTGSGGPFAVMNPLVDPSSMTPATALTYTAVPFTFTSATSAEPFLTNTVLAFYDTSTPPVLQFTLPTIFDPAPTISGGGTTYKLTTAITDFTAPFTYHVVPYNPTPGGSIDPLALNAPAFGLSGPVPFTFTVTANPNALAIVNPNPILLATALNTTSTVLNVSITNPGGAALMITAQSITGTNAANFSFAAPTIGTTCNFPGTITLAAGGGTCNFGMTYFANPTTPGNANSVATLTLTDNGSGNPQLIPITGVPLNSTVLVLVSPVNFGAVTIGTTSPTMNATLINLNPAALTVDSTGFTISGVNAADFHFTAAATGTGTNPACPALNTFVLAANSLCDVGLNFTPSIVGAENATIKVSDNGPGSPQNAPLLGIGVEITSISPSIVATGGPAFTLTVNGGGFAPSAVVNVSSINGTNVIPRLTTFVSANQLLASIPASDIAAAGSLAITVTTPVPGGTTSEPKTLIVAQAPVATNDNINFALNAGTTPARIAQDTTQATTDTGGVLDPTPPCGSGSKAKSVWYTFAAPANGRVIADTRFSSYTTIGSAWTGTPGSLVAVPGAGACASGNVPAAGASPVQSLLNFPVTSGTKYFVMVTDARTGTSAVGGTLTASLDFASAAPVNDDNAAPKVIAPTAVPYSDTVISILATADTNGNLDPALPVGCATGAASSGHANSVWYVFNPPSNGTITADTLTSPYDTILTAATGTPGNLTQVACNDNAAAGIAQSRVSVAATGGTAYFFMVSSFLGDGGTTNFHLTFTAAGNNPVPTITSFSPTSATAGGGAFVLTINGTNFVSGATGTFNGIARTVTFVSATQVTMAVTAPDIAAAGSFPVIISNPAPGGGPSAPMNFLVNNPVPTTTSISPTSATAGGAGFTLTVNGTNFNASSVVNFNGAGRTTTFVSATQVTASITAADIATAGSVNVTVTNPAPGGGTSGAQTFTINNPAPTITSLSPTGATAGGAAFTLTVNGTGFVATSSVKFNGTARTTTFVNATQVTAAILASDIASVGTPPVTVTNPTPGGGTSNAVNFNVSAANNPVPTLTSISPTTTAAGGAAFTLTLTGTNFIASSTVNFGANPPLVPTAQTSTQLQVTVPAADIASGGNVNVTVTNPAPGGGTSAAQSFTITNPAATITSFSPTSATAGGAAFTLTINGSNFVSGATGTFNAAARTVTFVSSTQVTMAVTAPDIATAGSFPVVVSNPAPGGGSNGAVLFPVNNVVPTLTSISPTSATVGGAAFTLTLNGAGFVSGSTVKFGVTAPTATFVSSTQLTAVITAPDIATAGVVTVSVTNPAPGGGTSGTQNFSINNPVPAITSFSPTSATAGGAAFTLTINGTNFVSGATGTFNGTGRTVTFVSATQVTMAVTAPDIATAGSLPVVVSNPGPGGGASPAMNFPVNNPAPTITSLSPTSATAGGAGFTLTVNGTGFVSASSVKFNGTARTTTFVSAAQVTAAITAADIATAGTFGVTVTNPAPGGGTSITSNFTVNNPVPTITSFSPTSATAGGAAFTLTINGTNFVSGATGTFNSAARTVTFVSATQVTMAVTAPDIATAGSFAVIVSNPAPGGGASAPSNFTANNPAPTISSLSPTGATAGGASFTLTVNGTGFVSTSSVKFNGNARTTTFVSATQVTAAILAADIASAGSFPVTVTNPAPGGGTSTSVAFNVSVANNPVPTLTSISPTSATAGGAGFTLTATGTNFVSTSVVNFNGAAKTTTFVSATQVTAAITAADIANGGVVNVTVTNPAPGGGTTSVQSFTINNPAPTITTLSPTSATAGGAGFTLTVNGTGFVPSSSVKFNGNARTTTFVSATQVTASITAADIATAGTLGVTVTNPAPGGGTSTATNFTVNNLAPTITSLSPTSATAGGAAFTLTVNGTNFVAASVVNFNGAAKTTTFVSATQITAAITAADIATAGTPSVTVTNPSPGGGASGAQTFTINNPAPAITSLSPTGATAGGAAFTLTVNGTGFVSSSAVKFNGTAKTTTFVSATQLTAAITAADIAAAGSANVTVTNPAPGGGTSTVVVFNIASAPNPVPTLTSISPTSATAGGAAFTLTVNGTNYVSSSVVNFNGSARTTTVVSATQLTASITAADIATAGSFPITVFNPAPGGGTSSAVNLTVNNPVPAITSLSPASANVGGAAFTLTVNGTGFVSGASVSFNGSARTTTFVSATQVTAAITAADIAAVGIFQVVVTNPAPGGGASGPVNFAVNNPLPAITLLSPSSATAGGAAFTLTVNGTGFVAGAVVNFNGSAKATTFVSSTQVTAAILATDIATGGSVNVTVTNPAPGGGTSATATFIINNPAPTITSLSPTSATAGGAAFTLTVNGTNFVSISVVNFNGAAKTTTFVTATQITASITAADIATAGTLPVTVTNPAPGGGTSAATNFTVNNPVPTITSLSPTSATAGGAAFTLTVNGTNFVSTSVVKFNGAAKTTTFVSATQVTAAITAADIAVAGAFPVTVTNPAPGGGTSAAINFTVNNPVPTITSLAPTSATVGGAAFVLTVNGTNFVAISVVNFNGAARATTFKSATQLTAAILATDIVAAGVVNVTVTNPLPGGGTSTASPFTINNPQPVITSLSPSSAAAGGAAFTLTINGSSFVTGAKVDFGTDKGLTPTSVTAAQIKVTIPAADIATGGAPNVVVNNPAPAVAPSAPSPFTVNNPVPTLTGATVNANNHISGGASFVLTATGTQFVSTSTINFNGKAEPTTFVSATQITAAIPASDAATAGTFPVTVTNPAPAGGTSTPAINFTIDGFTLSGPATTTVQAGKQAMIQISVKPTANGFTNAVTSFGISGLPAHTTFAFSPTSVTPNGATVTTTLTVTTIARGEVPPTAPLDPPVSPLLRLLPVLWLAALLAGLYAMQAVRRAPQLRRYAAIVPLALLLISGALLAGCAGGKTGTAAGTSQLSITATSGSMSQTTPANSVALTVQ
jgi:hypothetical protein